MKTKIIQFFLLALLSPVSIFAQERLNPISIGDKVPDFTFKNLINHSAPTLNIKDFKGKILILDFWDSYCTSCVASWPKLIKLQEEFKDKVKIILVNPGQKDSLVRSVINRQERIHNYKMNLTVAYDDKKIKELFPYESVPHVIFIDPSGTVKYVTYGFSINSTTIAGLIAGKEQNVALKVTEDVYIDCDKPLYIDGNVGKNDSGKNIVWNTVITPYSPDILSLTSFGSNREKAISMAYFGNYDVKSMLAILYGNNDNLSQAVRDSRIQFRDLDSSKLVRRINGNTIVDNWYTYQFITNKYMPEKLLRSKILTDLEQYFGLTTHMEQQKRQCIVLTIDPTKLNTYKDGDMISGISENGIDVNSITVTELIDGLTFNVPAFYKTSYPVVDETNFTYRLGKIKIQADGVMDYEMIKQELSAHGLKLSIQEREVDILVISTKR